MSAEIIDLQAWRRAHCVAKTKSVSVPLLLPTWPWGWLQPVLVEVEVGMMTESPRAARQAAAQANLGRRSHQNIWQSPAANRERRATATPGRLFLVPSSEEGENHGL